MLKFLSIENIAVIEKCTIDFGTGFQVMTGETGAGKSIIINSLNLLRGERASKQIIRNNENLARVQGVFDADKKICEEIEKEAGIKIEDDEIIVLRELTSDGKNSVRINGQPATLSCLKQIGHLFADIYGQHDGTGLLNAKTHISYLDAYGKEKIYPVLLKYREIYDEYQSIFKKINELKISEQEKSRKLDMLTYQIEEIEVADLKENEEEELNDKRLLLANAQKIAENSSEAFSLLYDGNGKTDSAYDLIWSAVKKLEQIKEFDKKTDEICSALTDAAYVISDSAHELRHNFDSMKFDPYELSNVEERLDKIFSLKRKYGDTIKDILDYLAKIKEELSQIEKSEDYINELSEKADKLEIQKMELSAKLTLLRKEYAKKLSKAVLKELSELNMKKTEFEISINETDYTKNGKDSVEFMISPNAGEKLTPLAKSASGGELSRIMLAIKTVLSSDDKTLIFDEADSGVSGLTAQRIAQKLYKLSKKAQVLCITHLPQIASFADDHYFISKSTEGGRTKTSITKLDKDGHIKETARLLSGEKISDVTIENAKELIKTADEIKKSDV